MMRHLGHYRSWSLLPVLVWILVQFAMVGGLAAAQVPSQDRTVGSFGFGSIVICTPLGLVEVGADALGRDAGGTPAPDAPPASAGDGCEWCKAFSHAVLPRRTVTPSRHPYPSGTVRIVRPRSLAVPAQRAAEGFRSRAPPV